MADRRDAIRHGADGGRPRLRPLGAGDCRGRAHRPGRVLSGPPLRVLPGCRLRGGGPRSPGGPCLSGRHRRDGVRAARRGGGAAVLTSRGPHRRRRAGRLRAGDILRRPDPEIRPRRVLRLSGRLAAQRAGEIRRLGTGRADVVRARRGPGRAGAHPRECAAARAGPGRLDAGAAHGARTPAGHRRGDPPGRCRRRDRTGRDPQQHRRTGVPPHDLAVRAEPLHRQQPPGRRHLHVVASRPRRAGVRATRREGTGGSGDRPVADAITGVGLLDRARGRVHDRATG